MQCKPAGATRMTRSAGADTVPGMDEDIIELSPAQALARVRAGARLVDVREEGERAAGMVEGALGVAGAALCATPDAWLPQRGQSIGLICASGRRSREAARRLGELGYGEVWSVAGGLARWREEGLPVGEPLESADFLERYSRHLLLPEVGLVGQRRLQASRVALLGAGGLGSPVALYLAAAGVGHLTLIDDDHVERSNLQRQVLHGEADIGRAKVASAAATLRALNPEVNVEERPLRLRADNVEALLGGHDLVVDGADNFVARYLVNDACARLGLPMVYGALERFRGQVAVFWPARHAEGGCYRCLFPEPPPPEFAPNCSEAGVLGVLPGLIGMLQATEALKLLLGIGRPLLGELLRVDALDMRFSRLGLSRDPACTACGDAPRRDGYEDLAAVCASG